MTKFRHLLAAAGAMMLVAGCTSEHESIQEAKPVAGIRRIPIKVTVSPPQDEVETRLAQVGRDVVTRITADEKGTTYSEGTETLVETTLMNMSFDSPLEKSVLTQAEGTPGGLKRFVFAGEITVPTNSNYLLGYAGGVATPEASCKPMDLVPITAQYHQNGAGHLNPLHFTYSTVKAGSLDGTLKTALIATYCSTQDFKVNQEQGTANMDLQNLNALVEVTLVFTDAAGKPLAGKEVTDLQLRADGMVYDPLTNEERMGFATEGQIAEKMDKDTGLPNGLMQTIATRYQVRMSIQDGGVQVTLPGLCPKPTRAATSLVTDKEGKVEVGFSLLGGVEMPAFSIEGLVDGKPYTAVMSAENKTPESGKCYDFGEKQMKPVPELHISNPGDLASMSNDALNEALSTNGTLFVTGTLNDADLKAIGRFGYEENTLVTLNLSGVTGVTAIPEWMFCSDDSDCTSLERVVLPAIVTAISSYAFCGCSSLQHINLSHITEIGTCAFVDCTSLTKVTCSGATSLRQQIFAGCTSLTELVFTAPAFEEVAAFLIGGKNYDPFTDIVNRGNVTLRLHKDQEAHISDNKWYPKKSDCTSALVTDGQFYSIASYVDISGFKAVYCGEKQIY